MSNYYFGFRPTANGKVIMVPKASLTITTGDLTITAGNQTITAGNLTVTAGDITAGGKIVVGSGAARIIYAATDPGASSGTAGAVGSICLCGDGNIYRKSGTLNTNWATM
jgi:hypothetical protein